MEFRVVIGSIFSAVASIGIIYLVVNLIIYFAKPHMKAKNKC